MHCRRIAYGFVILLVATSGLLVGCHQETGPSPESQVEGLQMSSELERTKRKLGQVEKELAEKGDAAVLAKEEAEKIKKDVADREHVIGEKEAKIHTLEGEIAQMKKQDAFAFAEASKLLHDGLKNSSLDRYRQFVNAFPASPLVADANRAIAELAATVPRDTRPRAAAAVDPRVAEREAFKKYTDGWAKTEDLAPLLKNRSMAEVVKLLGPPNVTYREGTELGYTDKVVDSGGTHGTLVIGFEGDKVSTLRMGYLGKPVKP